MAGACTGMAFAQVPQGFNYQAAVRDVSGKPLADVSLQVRIGILSDTVSNTVMYEELFNPVRESVCPEFCPG